LFDGLGTLDHLFVSASPGVPGAFLEQDLAAASTFVDGKLLGSWMCARHAAPRMPGGGSITFTTGCAVVRPPGNAAMVTAAFAAVEALSSALALELGPLRVNTITPANQIKTLATVLARPLSYQPLSDEQARAQMAADTPAPYIDAFFRFYSDGEFDDSPVLETVQQITRNPPRRFEQWARAHTRAFA
jgi:NAD(P)-dependent dehydrogenase (short-subunit alcohol dehydrogenase family)